MLLMVKKVITGLVANCGCLKDILKDIPCLKSLLKLFKLNGASLADLTKLKKLIAKITESLTKLTSWMQPPITIVVAAYAVGYTEAVNEWATGEEEDKEEEDEEDEDEEDEDEEDDEDIENEEPDDGVENAGSDDSSGVVDVAEEFMPVTDFNAAGIDSCLDAIED